MAKFYHTPGPPAPFKVFLAVQVLHQPEPPFTYALAQSMAALAKAGIAAELGMRVGDPHVDDSRNRLVREFLKTDCGVLIFLDADLMWDAESLIDLCGHKMCDVVAGAYPYKQDEEAYPVEFFPGEIWSDSDGLIEVKRVSTGFLRIRRRVLEILAEKAVKVACKGDDEADTPLIFERTVKDGVRIGGDFNFCDKWRAMDGIIRLCPDYFMSHTGSKAWEGDLAGHLRRKNGAALSHGLKAIANGQETPAILNSMVLEWDNPWSATADFQIAAAMLARVAGGPVVECGSGLSTLCMAAAGAEVHALEHDAGWSRRIIEAARQHGLIDRIHIHYAPLAGGWYDVPEDLPRLPGLLVVDGPPRHLGDRGRALARFRANRYLFDDAQDLSVRRAVESLHGWRQTILGEERKFAVVDNEREIMEAAG